MAFNLCLCCWFLSRERWFIKLKFFHLSLVVRREGTLNRNLEICAYLLSGLWKVTENVSVVKKNLPPLCLIVLSDPGTILHSSCVDHELANPKIFLFYSHREQTEHTSHSFMLEERAPFLQEFIWRGQQNFIILVFLN